MALTNNFHIFDEGLTAGKIINAMLVLKLSMGTPGEFRPIIDLRTGDYKTGTVVKDQRFMIKQVFPYVLNVIAYHDGNVYEAYINKKDFWLEGGRLAVIPKRVKHD